MNARTASPLAYKSILVVEDEAITSLDLEEGLIAAGAQVCAASDIYDAMKALDNLQTSFDGAVLDVNLHNEVSFPIAERLEAMGVPFIFASASRIPQRWLHVPRMSKPYRLDHLLGCLTDRMKTAT